LSGSFFNLALPTQLSFLTASAGYDASQSAFTSQGWNYIPALTPQLLSGALAESQATNAAGLAALTNLGAAQTATISQDFNGFANIQENFMTSVSKSLATVAKNEGSGGSGLFGQILSGIGSAAMLLAL
jgi:hypothetical protein